MNKIIVSLLTVSVLVFGMAASTQAASDTKKTLTTTTVLKTEEPKTAVETKESATETVVEPVEEPAAEDEKSLFSSFLNSDDDKEEKSSTEPEKKALPKPTPKSKSGLYDAECMMAGSTIGGVVDAGGKDPAREKSVQVENMNNHNKVEVKLDQAICTFTPRDK